MHAIVIGAQLMSTWPAGIVAGKRLAVVPSARRELCLEPAVSPVSRLFFASAHSPILRNALPLNA